MSDTPGVEDPGDPRPDEQEEVRRTLPPWWPQEITKGRKEVVVAVALPPKEVRMDPPLAGGQFRSPPAKMSTPPPTLESLRESVEKLSTVVKSLHGRLPTLRQIEDNEKALEALDCEVQWLRKASRWLALLWLASAFVLWGVVGTTYPRMTVLEQRMPPSADTLQKIQHRLQNLEQNPLEKGDALQTALEALKKRIAMLENAWTPPGPQGPAGPQGPPGPRGQPAPDLSAEQQKLATQVAELRKQLQDLRAEVAARPPTPPVQPAPVAQIPVETETSKQEKEKEGKQEIEDILSKYRKQKTPNLK